MTQAQMGRPRTFDVDAALEAAMRVFWERGYEGASLTSLEEAMGIGRKSMYAAFGNKEDLFRAALQRYTDGPGSYVKDALAARTARDVAETFLRGAACATTAPEQPHGCMGVQGALAAGDAGVPARDALVHWRADGQALLSDRFCDAVRDGDLPPDADPDQLARFVMTVGNGLAVQAAGGASRAELETVVTTALGAWPTA